MDKDILARVFTEWDKRYKENPEQFDGADTSGEYGERAASYFLKLYSEFARE